MVFTVFRSMAQQYSFVLILSGIFSVVFCVYRLTRSSKILGLPLPPGPRTSWLGQVDLPQTYQWRTYAEWKQVYGDIIYINVLGNPILVLNTTEATTELLEKRSSNYSSRPFRTMVVELMGWDWLFSAMPYGNWWRRHRALFHAHFHSNTSDSYHPVQLKETRTLLRNLLHTPDNFSHHIRRSAAATVLNISYGHQVAEEGDSYVTLADKALLGLGKAGIWGTYLVDYVPILKYVPAWVPGAAFQRQAQEWRKLTRAMVDHPFEVVKQKMAKGVASPCFATVELENWMQSGRDPKREMLIKDVAAIAYAAGADTTVSAIVSFFLAMAIHPEIQEKAQKELDSVVGTERLPLFSDRSSLPYLDCIVWESLRWNPVTPLGLAHYVTEDDEYKGYLIPKGTTVLPNVWAILHDENTYPDPCRFHPDRYADRENNARVGINEIPNAAFGFGRRACPGRWLAVDTLWLTVASVLSVYNISKALDEHGKPIEPKVEYTSTLLSRPKPFPCRILPRSAGAAALIKQTADES